MGLGSGKTVLGALPPIVGFVLGREGSQMFYGLSSHGWGEVQPDWTLFQTGAIDVQGRISEILSPVTLR